MPIPRKTVADYANWLSGEQAPVIVGGQAVYIWASLAPEMLPETDPELEPFKPFVSKDCDVLGDQALLQELANRTKLALRIFPFGSPTPCLGYLYEPADPAKTPILEVLSSVHGLDWTELAEIQPLELDGRMFRTLSPLKLLKAKLANVVDLDQTGRQDLQHVRMLIICVRAYIAYAHSKATEGARAELQTLKAILNLCKTIIQSANGQQVAKQHDIDLWKCYPRELLEASPLDAVRNFCRHQLPKP